MASTIAMYSGLSGLTANARNLDVIGNNIANVNTTAYKSNRMLFASQFSRNFSLGSAPSTNNGGTNPAQVGLGVVVAGTQRNFSTGSLAATGDARDMAIEGDGFFIVGRGTESFFTRSGAFRQNSLNDLVTISGERLMGYGVDANFNIVPGLIPLTIPLGELPLTEATENVNFSGRLNSNGAVATRGSVSTIGPLLPVAGILTTASLLTDIDDPAQAGAQALFAVGQTIELTPVNKGGRNLPAAQLEVTATTTIQDYLDFLTDALGIDTTAGATPAGPVPGATFDNTTGIITVAGNLGTQNNIALTSTNIRLLDAGGTLIGSPFTAANTATADGESIRTPFQVYDSLGNPVIVEITLTLVDRPANNGTRWNYQLEAPADSDIALLVGTGQLSFDEFGTLNTPATAHSATINRGDAGSVDPFSFILNFNAAGSRVSAVAGPSDIAATFQDGTPPGLLSSFAVGNDGTITGLFSNGRTRTIGQVALAKFANAEGLVDIGSNLFAVGPNSGSPIITTPTQLGAGRIIGGALEQSNVDLAEEFIKLIQASTGYSAASRIITTTDQLFQQLLVLGR